MSESDDFIPRDELERRADGDATANDVTTPAVIDDRNEMRDKGPGRGGDLRNEPDQSDETF